MTKALDIDGPLWRFAAKTYGRTEVAQACLLLQDHCGVDVNVLLFALWLGSDAGIALDAAAIAKADAAVAAWRREIVAPLRNIRRRLKTGPEPAPIDGTEALRARLQDVEIEFERIELAVLGSLEIGDSPRASVEPVAQNADCVVRFYGGEPAEPAIAQALDDIATAIGARDA